MKLNHRNAILILLVLFASFTSPSTSSADLSKAWNSILVDDQTHWTDENGAAIVLKDFIISPAVIMTSFYTHCSRTCPEITFKALKKIEAKFQAKGQEAEFLLVTLEPEEDTPEILSKFKARVAPNRKHWHLLRADSTAGVRDFVKSADLGDFWKMEEHTLHEFKVLYLDSSSKSVKKLDFKHRDIDSLFTP